MAEIKVNPKLLEEKEVEEEGKSKIKKKKKREMKRKKEERMEAKSFCSGAHLLSELTHEQPRSYQIIHTFRNPSARVYVPTAHSA